MNKQEKDELLEQLMIEYGNELVRLAFSYVKDVEVAKDLVQNSFIKCYQHLEKFRQEAKYKTWLYRITINECKDYLKSWHFKMVQVKSFIQETTKSMMPSTEKAVIEKLKQEDLKEVVVSLPNIYREVIYLYYYDSFTTEEIADVLNLSVNTVKTRLRRAREKLHSTMKEEGLHE